MKQDRIIGLRMGARVPALVLAAAFLCPMAAVSGDYDCSLIYDEYDSLMAGNYLQTPTDYVDGYERWFTQPAFDSLQRGRFKLHPERGESGIIIFRTNHNRHGKLLYHWTDPLVDGRRYLVISEAAWYARVADGAGLELFGKLRANSGLGVDLDNLVLVDLEVLEDASVPGETATDIPAEAGGFPEPAVGQESSQLVTEEALVDGKATWDENDPSLAGDTVAEPAPEEEEIVLDRTLPAEAADLAVMRDGDTGIYYLDAINQAQLYFPVETLCRE